jgi:hypothetical protein
VVSRDVSQGLCRFDGREHLCRRHLLSSTETSTPRCRTSTDDTAARLHHPRLPALAHRPPRQTFGGVVTIASAPSLSRLLRLVSLHRATSRPAFNEARFARPKRLRVEQAARNGMPSTRGKRGRCTNCLKRNLAVIAPMQCERLELARIRPAHCRGPEAT